MSWKAVYSFLLILLLFLIPFAYAEESVDITYYQDGSQVEELKKGDVVTLHSELVSANTSDYVKIVLQDSKLEFVDNPSGTSMNVFGRFNDNLWIYETKVKVLEDNPAVPKAQVIRDSTQPDLIESEKPESLTINLNSEQIITPGDLISANVVLEPQETVNPTYYNYVEWKVTYGDTEIESENLRGESTSFTVPDDAANKTIKVEAVLKGSECGLGKDLSAQSVELKVKDDSLSVRIFPSTDSDGVLLGKFLGFSSEIIRNGNKVAESSISDSSDYTWSAKIGEEFVNGQRDGKTGYAVSPDRVGTLVVSLKVTLDNGLTIESEPVTKTVVEEEHNLESIKLSKRENGTSTVGSAVEVVREYQPAYPTNLDEATYHWTATQNEEVIAESDKNENFVFTPEKTGSVTVQLEVTPKESEEKITGEALQINILEPGQEDTITPVEPEIEEPKTDQTESPETTEPEKDKDTTQESEKTEQPETKPDESQDKNTGEPLKIISGVIKSNKGDSVAIGDTVVLNASLSTQGKSGDVSYSWEATDSKGNVIKESNELKDFSFTTDQTGKVKVEFSAIVKNDNLTNSVEEAKYQRLDLNKNLNFVTASEAAGKQDDSKTDSSNGNKTTVGSQKTPEQTKESTVSEKGDVTEIAQKEETSQNNSDIKTEDLESKTNNTANQVNTDPTQIQKDSLTDKNDTSTEIKEDVSVNKENTGVVEQKSGAGLNTSSSQTSNPTPFYSTSSSRKASPVSSSNSVLSKSSNIANPKTGVDFTIGQISVIIVCSFLIVTSVIILLKKIRPQN